MREVVMVGVVLVDEEEEGEPPGEGCGDGLMAVRVKEEVREALSGVAASQ